MLPQIYIPSHLFSRLTCVHVALSSRPQTKPQFITLWLRNAQLLFRSSKNKTPIYNSVVKECTTAVQKPISLQLWGLPVPIFHQNLLMLHLQSRQWRQLVPLKHWSAPTCYNTMSQTKIQYEILSHTYCFIIKLQERTTYEGCFFFNLRWAIKKKDKLT